MTKNAAGIEDQFMGQMDEVPFQVRYGHLTLTGPEVRANEALVEFVEYMKDAFKYDGDLDLFVFDPVLAQQIHTAKAAARGIIMPDGKLKTLPH